MDSKHKKIPAETTNEHRTHEEDTAVIWVDINHKEVPTAAIKQGVQLSQYPQQAAVPSATPITAMKLSLNRLRLYTIRDRTATTESPR